MQLIKTEFQGLYIIETNLFCDERGYLFESYKEELFKDLKFKNLLELQTLSKQYVLRGLHYQTPPCEQSKIIRVLSGKIVDVVVDIRKSSPTFGQSFSIELSEYNNKQLFIPKGFAHGYVTISKEAKILYKLDNLYSPNHEKSIKYNDKNLNIDWSIDIKKVIVSEKDKLSTDFLEADLFE